MDLISSKNLTNYLIFEVNKSLFGIYSNSVIELIWLTELSDVDSSPKYVVGFFNFRGSYLPLIDLSLRQNKETKRYSVHDRILIVNYNHKQFGIHIDEVHNVLDLNLNQVNISDSKLIDKILETEFGMTQILNLDILSNFELMNNELDDNSIHSNLNIKLVDFNETELQILKKRKESYSISTSVQEYSRLQSFIIFKISDEYFSLELKNILEFSSNEGITKIPCVPKHIYGCLNLRGDILVIIDLQYIINFSKTSSSKSNKIIVIKYNEMLIGIVVDELIDVIYLTNEMILGTPIDKKNSENDFLKGTCKYESKIVGMLDVEKIFEYEKLYVDEYVHQ